MPDLVGPSPPAWKGHLTHDVDLNSDRGVNYYYAAYPFSEITS